MLVSFMSGSNFGARDGGQMKLPHITFLAGKLFVFSSSELCPPSVSVKDKGQSVSLRCLTPVHHGLITRFGLLSRLCLA